MIRKHGDNVSGNVTDLDLWLNGPSESPKEDPVKTEPEVSKPDTSFEFETLLGESVEEPEVSEGDEDPMKKPILPGESTGPTLDKASLLQEASALDLTDLIGADDP